MLRFTSLSLRLAWPASCRSRLASARDFSMSREKPADGVFLARDLVGETAFPWGETALQVRHRPPLAFSIEILLWVKLGCRSAPNNLSRRFGCTPDSRLGRRPERVVGEVPGIGIGGRLTAPPLPHHLAYGSRTSAVRPG